MRWHARSLLHLHLVTADHMTETNLFRFLNCETLPGSGAHRRLLFEGVRARTGAFFK